MNKVAWKILGLCALAFIAVFWKPLLVDADRGAALLRGDDVNRETAQLKASVTACRKQEQFDRLIKLAAANDTDGYTKYWTEAMTSGQCRGMSKGQKVVVQGGGLFSGQCIRLRDEKDCWYVAPALLAPID